MRRALLAAAAVVLAACGTNVSREEIRAAAGGTVIGPDGAALVAPGAAAATASNGTAPSARDAASAGGGAQPDGGSVTNGLGDGAGSGGSGAAVSGGCPDPCAPLVIGAAGTWSGLVGQNVVGGLRALQAWASWINGNGGLGGHEVRLEVVDDGADPARHRAQVQELVEERGVVAFVYNAAVFSGQASVDYLEQRQIPVVGGAGTDPWYTTSPVFFTQVIAGTVAIEATTASYARSAKAEGLSALGLVTCSDGVQVCEDTQREVPQFASKYGLQLVYNGEASLASPDFTANCLAARNAGVQLLYIALDANSYQRFSRACANVGYHPRFGIAQPVMLEELARDPNLQGSPGVSYTAPFFFDQNAAVAEFRQVMATFAPDVPVTGSAILGWSAAKLLEISARGLSGTPASADVLEGLWALDGEDLGGLTPPLRFARGAATVPPVCYWQVVVRDQQFQSPDGGQRHCEG